MVGSCLIFVAKSSTSSCRSIKKKKICLSYTMSSANVLPSAPPEGVENYHSQRTHQYTQTYPDLSIISNAENFRLTEISKIKKQIDDEVEHYRVARKKYKKVHKAINNTVSVLGVATTAISSAINNWSWCCCWCISW